MATEKAIIIESDGPIQDERTLRVAGRVGRALEQLAEEWTVPMKFTFIARNPAHPDGSWDFVLTDDTMDAIITTIRQRLT